MHIEELVTHYPRLYHMAERGSWESIRRHGLLSTRATLDLFGITGARRHQLEASRRPEKTTIEHTHHGRIVLRDQKPLSDSTLVDCLDDKLRPTDWYQLLNGKVFFWTTEERLLRLLKAQPYRNDEHDVLTIDTQSLVAAHRQRIHLCHMNSGASIPWKQRRGANTFRSIDQYQFAPRARRNGKPVVELVVEYAVPNIVDFVISVDTMQADQHLKQLHP